MNAWRKLNFVTKFFLVFLAVGLSSVVFEWAVVSLETRAHLAQGIRPVRFENAELGPALQQLADSTQPLLKLSMCPDVAARRVTATTTTEMPLKEFVVLLAGQVGADVDLARHRHGGSYAARFPHLYFAAAPCQTRSFVYVVARAERTARTPAASADPAGTLPSPRSPSPP
jgi:hypothetical protein